MEGMPPTATVVVAPPAVGAVTGLVPRLSPVGKEPEDLAVLAGSSGVAFERGWTRRPAPPLDPRRRRRLAPEAGLPPRVRSRSGGVLGAALGGPAGGLAPRARPTTAERSPVAWPGPVLESVIEVVPSTDPGIAGVGRGGRPCTWSAGQDRRQSNLVRWSVRTTRPSVGASGAGCASVTPADQAHMAPSRTRDI